MDVFEAIEKRHSYRGPFTDDPVSRDDLRRIVQAGLLAPSGCNAQTTTFVIVDEAAEVARLRDLHPRNQAMRSARAYIVGVVDKTAPPVYEELSFQVEDYSAAVENILLAVTALGYATVWIDGWLRREGHAERIGEALGLPEGKVARVILPIGVAQETNPKRPEKKPFEERAWFNRYGAGDASA